MGVQKCDVSIGDFHIEIDGGHGGIYQTIVDMLSGPLKSAFEDEIESVMKDQLTDLFNTWLPRVPVSFPLLNGSLTLDYALINASAVHALSGKECSENDFNGHCVSVERENLY